MRFIGKRRTLLGIAAALVCGLYGCGDDAEPGARAQPGDGGTVRVALLMKARTNPFFDQMARGAERAASEHNVALSVMAIDRETDTAGQAAHVETAIARGAQVILIAPADSKAIIAPLLRAQARGVRIINLDNRIDAEEADRAGLDVVTFIGPDNRTGARKSAEALIEAMGGEGAIAMLEGIRGVDNAEARKQGFLDAVEATDGRVRIVAMDSADWATEPAQQKMEAILNTHRDLKGVFCANDMMALGAIQAIGSAGKADQVLVSGYDNLEPARQAIAAGTLVATIDQHPALMGARGVEAAVALMAGEPVAPEIAVPTDLVTRRDLSP